VSDEQLPQPPKAAQAEFASAAEPNFEQARAELVAIVRELETGSQTLEESLALWQRGEELATICQRWLEGATRRLNDAIAARDSRENAAG